MDMEAEASLTHHQTMKLISAIAAAALAVAPACSQSNLRAIKCTTPSLLDQSPTASTYIFDRKGQTYDFDRVSQSWVETPATSEEYGDRWELRSAIVGNVYRVQQDSVSLSNPLDAFTSLTEIDLNQLTITSKAGSSGAKPTTQTGTCQWVAVETAAKGWY